MSARLDHTILDVSDREQSIRFYTDVLGFEYAGSTGYFEVLRVNDDLTIDLVEADDPDSRHLAFAMDRLSFDSAFERLKDSGRAFGDGPSSLENMRGPGRSSGTHGTTYSVYFHDPSGHVIEIITYED